MVNEYDINSNISQNNDSILSKQGKLWSNLMVSPDIVIDQIKKNYIISIDSAKDQISTYGSVFETYQETAKNIYKSLVEPQMTSIKIIYSNWAYDSERVTKSLNPNVAIDEYTKFSNTVYETTISSFKTINNLAFSSLESWKSLLQNSTDNSNQILNLNTEAAKTLDHNTKKVLKAAQDAYSKCYSHVIVSLFFPPVIC